MTRQLLQLWMLLLPGVGTLHAAEQLPPVPKRYFNDYAHVVAPDVAESLNRKLEDFEKATSSQIVVAVFDKLPADAALEDYTVRTFKAWKPGQQGKDNGAVLFVFVQDRKMRIEVGYGLEAVLPDALAKRIIDEQIAPPFRQRDYTGGLSAGVDGILQAVRGEYKGTGQTAASRGPPAARHMTLFIFLALLAFFFLANRRRGTMYSRRGRSPWGGYLGGCGWGGGGGGGFSSGGFSGGGGRSGGGGASGSW